MKIFILITFMLSTLFSVENKGDGTLELKIDSSKDSVEGGLRYVYSFTTIMGDPLAAFKAQWSITKVHFNFIKDVGENLTYDVCKGEVILSCIPKDIMRKASMAKLSLRGSGGTLGAGYSYVFDAGAMSKPKVYAYNMDGYGKMSFNTPESANWSKTFYVDGYKRSTFPTEGDTSKYHNEETAKGIVRMGVYFSSFKIEKITFNLEVIRAYIEDRVKEVEKVYDKLMAKDKKQNIQRVTAAQKRLRDTENSRALVDNFIKYRQDKAETESKEQRERHAREKMKLELKEERLVKEEREAEQSIASSEGVFVDSSTGLMWQDNEDNEKVKLEWSMAKKYCKNLSLAGYDDWYLANKKQLKGLYGKKNSLKYVWAGFYWSSNLWIGYASRAWVVDSNDGYSSGDNWVSRSYHVRCVRVGQ